MLYLNTMTDMLAGASVEHERHVYQTYQLIDEMIKQIVPEMIEEYWKNHIEDIIVNIITQLNGKQNDLSGLRADIAEIIMAQLSK